MPHLKDARRNDNQRRHIKQVETTMDLLDITFIDMRMTMIGSLLVLPYIPKDITLKTEVESVSVITYETGSTDLSC